MRDAQRGGPGALDALLARLRPSFLSCFAPAIGWDDAEDATQLALLSIASALPGIDPERAFTYVVAVAGHRLGKARRRRVREARRFAPVELADTLESPVRADWELEDHELHRVLAASLAALPPALRDTLPGPLGALVPSTPAAQHHVNPATIRSRRRYARARLRAALARHAEGMPAVPRANLASAPHTVMATHAGPEEPPRGCGAATP